MAPRWGPVTRRTAMLVCVSALIATTTTAGDPTARVTEAEAPHPF